MSAPEPIPLSSAKAEHYTKLRARLAVQKASEHEAISAIDELCHDNERLALRSQAAVAAALEEAAQTVDALGDSAVTEALGTRLCCDGHMCGCQGADVGAYILHHIRALITPAQHDALDAHVAAEVAKARAEDAAKLLAAAGQEYLLDHVMETESERMGRRSAVRGMMVRMGLYVELEGAIDAAQIGAKP